MHRSISENLAKVHKNKASLPLLLMSVGLFIGAHPHASNTVKWSTLLLTDALHSAAMLTSFLRIGEARVMAMLVCVDLPFNVAFLVGWVAAGAAGSKSVRAWTGGEG